MKTWEPAISLRARKQAQGRKDSHLRRRTWKPESCCWKTPLGWKWRDLNPHTPACDAGALPLGHTPFVERMEAEGLEPSWSCLPGRCLAGRPRPRGDRTGREGFEPSGPPKGPAALATRCLQPLGHLPGKDGGGFEPPAPCFRSSCFRDRRIKPGSANHPWFAWGFGGPCIARQ